MATAVELVKEFEGCNLHAYQDGGGVWTVGYGATGPKIGPGTVWAQEQAEADLAHRLDEVRTALGKLVDIRELNENQIAALVSFIYNVGVHAFAKSTMLGFIQTKNWIAGAKEFPKWNHDNGKEVKGLLKRRLKEAYIFLS